MKKKMVVFFVLVILSFFGMIRSNEPVARNGELGMHVNVVNDLNNDLDDVHLSMLIYDLGIVVNTNTFDVDDRDNVGKFLFWEAENIPPGDYLVRITVSNDDFRNVKHRYISII